MCARQSNRLQYNLYLNANQLPNQMPAKQRRQAKTHWFSCLHTVVSLITTN